jgi:hypothetical protein
VKRSEEEKLSNREPEQVVDKFAHHERVSSAKKEKSEKEIEKQTEKREKQATRRDKRQNEKLRKRKKRKTSITIDKCGRSLEIR